MNALYLLIALMLYVLLAWLAVYLVKKYTGSTIAKYLTVAVFILIPSWDILPGRLYFQRLCEKEAGIKVFKTVEVDSSFFTREGQPDQNKLGELYLNKSKLQESFSSLFHIKRSISSIQEKQTGVILGTATAFSYYGGWFIASFSPQGPPSKCPDYLVHGVLWKEVIKSRQDSTGR